MNMKTLAAPLAGLLLLLTINEGNTMNANLTYPYGDSCSPPQTPYLSFHSPQSPNLLFTSGARIAIVCGGMKR